MTSRTADFGSSSRSSCRRRGCKAWRELQSRMQAALAGRHGAARRTSALGEAGRHPPHAQVHRRSGAGPPRSDQGSAGQPPYPSSPNIELSFSRAGSFSDQRSPRVIWAGIETPQREQLYALAASIETWLAAAGVPRERRGFTPHLTLARLPQELPDAMRTRIAEVTTAIQAPEIAPFVVRAVSLIQSHLGPGGARYERLMVYPISALQPPPRQI